MPTRSIQPAFGTRLLPIDRAAKLLTDRLQQNGFSKFKTQTLGSKANTIIIWVPKKNLVDPITQALIKSGVNSNTQGQLEYWGFSVVVDVKGQQHASS